jgi:pSer/pThr/pTyr-binding forkhead associated (FHA) protein
MAEGELRVRLIVLTGHRVGEEAAVTEALVIGRLPECGLHVDETGVSRRHAEVRLEGEEVWLRDLGSSNGTKLHGARVSEAKLADGDVFEVGHVKVRVRIEQAPVAPVAPLAAPSAGELDEIVIGGHEAQPEPSAETPARAPARAPATPAPAARREAAPAPEARGRGPLQYHRIEGRGGMLRDDLGQSPLWVRALVFLVVIAVAAGLFWLAYTAAAGA